MWKSLFQIGALLACAVVGLNPAPAHAEKPDPFTCADRITYAKSISADWTVPDTLPGVTYIDGAGLTTPELFEAVIGGASGTATTDDSAKPLGRVSLIKGGDFSGWDFSAIPIAVSSVCFFRSNLAGSRWDDGIFFGLGFIESDLTNASFRNARILKIAFESATLRGSDMHRAWLNGGRLAGNWDGSVENWNLSEANLENFLFDCGITIEDGCPLDRGGVNFSGADLTNADISTFPTWGDAKFANTILDGTLIAPKQITGLSGVIVRGPIKLTGGRQQVLIDADELARLQASAQDYAKADSQPSFPCARAGSRAEHMICGEYETRMRGLDRALARLYAVQRAADPNAGFRQKNWLRVRDQCEDTDCLTESYNSRIAELLADAGEPQFLERGQSSHYIADTIRLPDSFRTDPLYRKIVPALVGEARMAARITREENGSYSIIGNAIGANAHICNLSGSGLFFDAESGWFSGSEEDVHPIFPRQGRAIPLFQIVGDELTIINDGHPEFLPRGPSNPYVSCGARASFVTMHRLDYDAGELEKMIQFFDY